jgi:hypothetical protein
MERSSLGHNFQGMHVYYFIVGALSLVHMIWGNQLMVLKNNTWFWYEN